MSRSRSKFRACRGRWRRLSRCDVSSPVRAKGANKGPSTSLATSALPAAYAAYASVGSRPPPCIWIVLGALRRGSRLLLLRVAASAEGFGNLGENHRVVDRGRGGVLLAVGDLLNRAAQDLAR